MNGLALQIDGKWAVLGEDVSVSVEGNSPIWGEGNSFSLPFELDVEANRHILGNSDQITGQSVYEVLDGKRAILYTLGIPVYYGIIKLEDEVEIDEGKIDVTLVSGSLTFEEMIEGMNCQDVELMDRFIVGERVTEFTVSATDGGTNYGTLKGYFPDCFMWPTPESVNVSNPYPVAKYCNIRVCYQIPDKNADGEDMANKVIKGDGDLKKVYDPDRFGKYVVLDENRANSSICFYVMYFLDCLFKGKLGMDFSSDGITYMEDMCRLAFCTTRCSYDEEQTDIVLNDDELEKTLRWAWMAEVSKLKYSWSMPLKKCVANSKNFPNVDVSELIKGLENGFGIRFLYDAKSNSMKCIYIRDIIKDSGVISIPGVEIYETFKVDNGIKGFRLTYGGPEDDTAYNYKDWDKNVSLTDKYNYILSNTTANNKKLYIHTKSGNAYRIKIDDDARTSSEKNPALFEVGAFNDAEFGNCSDENSTEEVKIGFAPVTMNDVYSSKRRNVVRGTNRTSIRSRAITPEEGDGGSEDAGYSDSEANDQMFAFYMDVNMKFPSWVAEVRLSFTAGRYTPEIAYTYFDSQRYDEARTEQSKSAYEKAKKDRKGVGNYITAEQFDNKSPIQEYDTGLMFGVMRGPGNKSGVEEFDENYDGEGNSRYVLTSVNSAFHSDTVDNYSRAFDYNGLEEEGVDQSGRFSLKLRAEKPNPEGGFYPITETYAQKRGLFDKFYTEYAYFVVNRKIVRMICRMEMADILNIDWTKRYKIGDYIGFINKYSYTISADGMSDVELEMYYI